MTTVTCDDDSTNIYTVTVGLCDLQTSVDYSKYEEIHQNALICPGGSIFKKNEQDIRKRDNSLVHCSWNGWELPVLRYYSTREITLIPFWA